jgi:hypothetical protein
MHKAQTHEVPPTHARSHGLHPMTHADAFSYRVTKYNPAYRREDGRYTRDAWTSRADIGRTFAGQVLTQAAYQQVEDAYISAALAFLREANVTTLAVTGLENHALTPLPFAEGSALDLTTAAAAIRGMLREDFWCRLESEAAFVHIGWDYYMYIHVPHRCPDAVTLAHNLGLFVEPCLSPYAEQGAPR